MEFGKSQNYNIVHFKIYSLKKSHCFNDYNYYIPNYIGYRLIIINRTALDIDIDFWSTSVDCNTNII